MRFFQIRAVPGKVEKLVLSVVIFALCIAVYVAVAHFRHAQNPQEKIMPTAYQMTDGFLRTIVERGADGNILPLAQQRLVIDTLASAKRFGISVALLFFGILIGLHMGILPYAEQLLLQFVLFFDKVPALLLLPILFVVFGLDELSKIALCVLGVMPTIILDTYNRAKEVPQEEIVKGMTLGASDMEIAYRIVLPRIFPKAIDAIRLNLKSVALFVIAGESLAASEGLAYRIFVIRRYMAMDVIIPYVLWASFLFFLTDFALRLWVRKRYPWVDKG